MHDIFAPTVPSEPPVADPGPSEAVAESVAAPSPLDDARGEVDPPQDPWAGAGTAGRNRDRATTTEPGGQGPRSTASLDFAAGFRPESPHAGQARRCADELGIRPIEQDVASTLSFLAAAVQAHAVVEIGSGTGVSGLALFAGMTPQGVLTSIDTDPEPQREARSTFREAGITSSRFRLISGDALTVMPKLSDGAYDMVFVDADPLEYGEYIEHAAALLRDGGVLVVNNALWHGLVADEDNEDNETIVIREALDAVTEMDEVWTSALLPVGNGLLVASRRAR